VGICFLAVTGFTATHTSSFFANRKSDSSGIPGVDSLISLPYARVAPIFITLILFINLSQEGGVINVQTGQLLVFLILKMVAEIIMHIVEHKLR
jgi:hypothetical protein